VRPHLGHRPLAITRLRSRYPRAMARRVSQVNAGGHGPETAAKRRASWQARHPGTQRSDTAPPSEVRRDQGYDMERDPLRLTQRGWKVIKVL
jgi:hypothetical protein